MRSGPIGPWELPERVMAFRRKFGETQPLPCPGSAAFSAKLSSRPLGRHQMRIPGILARALRGVFPDQKREASVRERHEHHDPTHPELRQPRRAPIHRCDQRVDPLESSAPAGARRASGARAVHQRSAHGGGHSRYRRRAHPQALGRSAGDAILGHDRRISRDAAGAHSLPCADCDTRELTPADSFELHGPPLNALGAKISPSEHTACARATSRTSAADRGCVKTRVVQFWYVNFGHVGSISAEFSPLSSPQSRLRGGALAFSHSLDPKQTVTRIAGTIGSRLEARTYCGSRQDLMMSDEHEKDYDSFFLKHLQSIHAEGAWYLNQRFIGKGGNGTTFFVTCTSGPNAGVQFALKVFHKISDARRRQRFLEEVRHYRTLSHPSIIRVYDEGTFRAGAREYPFAVVDFASTNLESKLGNGPTQITRLESIRYISNIAAGIFYLHSQENPIIHRDIKPANVLLSGSTARLGDLGLAKVLMGNDTEDRNDVAEYIAMPRFYRTPELISIARGERLAITVASDIYQLGLVLYRAITGFNPQKPPKDDMREDIELDLREIHGIASDDLNGLVSSMLKHDPTERPTAEVVVQQLSSIHRKVCEADLAATGMMR